MHWFDEVSGVGERPPNDITAAHMKRPMFVLNNFLDFAVFVEGRYSVLKEHLAAPTGAAIPQGDIRRISSSAQRKYSAQTHTVVDIEDTKTKVSHALMLNVVTSHFRCV